MKLRHTTQDVFPLLPPEPIAGEYDIYPVFTLDEADMQIGYRSLADYLVRWKTILIDGFSGILWEHFKQNLDRELKAKGIQTCWIHTGLFMKAVPEIDTMVAGFLGGDDPLFGRRCSLDLEHFFQPGWTEKINAILKNDTGNLQIIWGTGAFLSGIVGYKVYIDMPKNEIIYRARAGAIANLGHIRPGQSQAMYKRFYFVDWQVLNRQKRRWLGEFDLMIDGQREDSPVWMSGSDFRHGLDQMTASFVRPRPWFQPAPWGGTYMKEHFLGLSPDVPNYGWSYDIIAPENGITFMSGSLSLEASFDFLMYHGGARLMGDHVYQQFDCEWPVRINYLDTMDGSNLSVQCHPRTEYVQKEFNEKFTQDECYYVMDCKNQSRLFLGFQEDIDPATFREDLLDSQRSGRLLDVEHHVQSLEAKKHNLYLIPAGTIHASGKDNLVLEISATTYNYTFKIYDWQRLDLDGKPRPINIGRAFDNLFFDRKGQYVAEHLVSHASCLTSGENWRVIHLPTHEKHFYDVHRIEFTGSVKVDLCEDSFHVLTLAEGKTVTVTAANGRQHLMSYLETLIIPFAAGSYTLTGPDGQMSKVLKTFVK